MAYGDFSLESACRAFALQLHDQDDLYAGWPPREPSDHLRRALDEQIPLATAIHTEKARSELIVAPILVEVRRVLGHAVALFSGVEFAVDPSRGLTGTCDFLLARSSTQLVIRAPVLTVVEAKRDNLNGGLGQCLATMVAALVFNDREGSSVRRAYGAVTTGTLWRFLELEGAVARIDSREYSIQQVAEILGILTSMLTGDDDRGRLVA